MTLVRGVVLLLQLMVRGRHVAFTARTPLSAFAITSVELFKLFTTSGRDKIVKEELYQGTSRGAEGYVACLTLKKTNKEKGMNIAVQWQDAGSSSSNAAIEHFPDGKVMICGRHAGRAHKKQLEKPSKIKRFSSTLVN